MDYYKYIKYKTKYLNLKYDNNQYGGGIVPCDKGYKNAFGTCWAVALQMILSSGHLTSDQLYEKMESFKQGVASVTEIKETIEKIKVNIKKFIEQQIIKIQSNTELTNAFAHYKIFEDDKIVIVKYILRKFIERYYNKFMNIPFTPKPPNIDRKTNKKSCEYKIATSFQNLFDYSRIKTSFHESIEGGYLFCNLLSIFLLDYKVSFTNYYDNFNTINFDDKKDLGILIHIHGHACCLFICNDEEKFYNDNDKQIYNCKWKDILDQETPGKQLYIIEGCLEFIDDIKTYKGDITKISKVFSLTVISKYTEDTPLDIDIKRFLDFKELDDIKDMMIQCLLGEHYADRHNFEKALKFYGLSAKQGYYLSQYRLGIMLYTGKGCIKDHSIARTMYKLAADQGFVIAQYNLGMMLYKGEGGEQNIIQAKKMADIVAKQDHFLAANLLRLILNDNNLNAYALFMLGCDLYDEHNFSLAREKFKLAANKGHAESQYRLGLMLYKGEGDEQNITLAREKFKLAADKGHAEAQYMLGTMLYNAEGGEKDYIQARQMFKLAANKGHAESQYRLGTMLYYGDGGIKNITQAREVCTLAANKGYAKAQYMLGMMLYNGEGGGKNIDQAREMFELAANQGNTQAKEMLAKMPTLKK